MQIIRHHPLSAVALLVLCISYFFCFCFISPIMTGVCDLKRCDPDIYEEAVLMRALRYFNTPKVCYRQTPLGYTYIHILRNPNSYTRDSHVKLGTG